MEGRRLGIDGGLDWVKLVKSKKKWKKKFGGFLFDLETSKRVLLVSKTFT
jgi:hypothetical protein